MSSLDMKNDHNAANAAADAMMRDLKNAVDDLDVVLKVLSANRDALVYAKRSIGSAKNWGWNTPDANSFLTDAKDSLDDLNVVNVGGKRVKIDVDDLLKGINAKINAVNASIA